MQNNFTWNAKDNINTKFTLTFAGDTSLGDYYFRRPVYEEQRMRLEKDPMSFFTGVISLLKDTSYLILNLETVLADNPVSPLEGRKKYLGWDNPERTLKVLKQIGVNAVSLANNHAMDFGPEILLGTMKQLIDVGIQPFGAGESIGEASKPIKIECKGKIYNKNIYIFGVMRVKWKKRFREDFNYHATKLSSGVFILEKKKLIKIISKLRAEEPDSLIIVFAHWQGFDYEWANEKKMLICKELIDSGADYFIGHGSHMMQQISAYDSGIAIYSIGNFVFNSKGGYQKNNAPPYSFVVRLELDESKDGWNINAKLYPIFSNNIMQNYRPRPVNESEVRKIITMLNEHALNSVQSSCNYRYDQDELGLFLLVDRCKEELVGKNIMDQMQHCSVLKLENRTYGKPIELDKNIYSTTEAPDINKNLNSQLIAREFEKLGFTVNWIDKMLFIVQVNKLFVGFSSTLSINSSIVCVRVFQNKAIVKEILLKSGIPVAYGNTYNLDQKAEAMQFVNSLNKPVVVKPVDANYGSGVSLGIQDLVQFENAWSKAKEKTKKGIIVEEQLEFCQEARFLVIDGKCISVVQRISPRVFGNGIDTIESLIVKKNKERLANPSLRKKPISLNKERINNLLSQGFSPNFTPSKGQEVVIDRKGGISTGGETANITEFVHQTYKDIAEIVASLVPGTYIMGVDILANNLFEKTTDYNYIVLEANTRPGIVGHHFPDYGKPSNIAFEIVKYTLKALGRDVCQGN